MAAVAAGLHLPRQPPPVLPRQLRVQHRVLGHAARHRQAEGQDLQGGHLLGQGEGCQ